MKRTGTSPGGYSAASGSAPGAVPADEEITRPDASGELVSAVNRLFMALKPRERVTALALVLNYSKCSLDRRVTIEAVARELAKVPWEVV